MKVSMAIGAKMATRIGLIAVVWAWSAGGVPTQQGDGGKYQLKGKVVNAVNGAAVANTLVQIAGWQLALEDVPQAQFSSPDGTFTFTGLPRGTYQLTATKPGYFNEQEMGGTYGPDAMHKVPEDPDALLKLTPEGIIYGRVENESGQPMEAVTVRLKTWQVSNGVKRLENSTAMTTDDEGQFRFAELRPGIYYVNFFPEGQGWRTLNGLARKNANEQGYGSHYYPGVSDVSLATPIRIHGGSQVQVTQELRPQRVFEVAGVLRGADGRDFQVSLMEPSGEPLQKNAHIDRKSGEFQIEEVPEGKYVLMAAAQEPGGNLPGAERPLTAFLPIQVNRDVTGLGVMLGRGANVDVKVEDEIPTQGEEIHPVQISLISKDFEAMSQGLTLPPPKGDVQSPRRFEGVAPGTYQVEAAANGLGYVALLRCGDVDLLRDELTIGAGAAVPPIEVMLRPDGAELQVQVTGNGKPGAVTVVVYSEEYPKSSLTQPVTGEGRTGFPQLRPGAYRIAAFPGAHEVEFQDQAFVEKYLAEAKEVNLKAGDKVEVNVEVQSREEE